MNKEKIKDSYENRQDERWEDPLNKSDYGLAVDLQLLRIINDLQSDNREQLISSLLSTNERQRKWYERNG